jgi:hypothetical protein
MYPVYPSFNQHSGLSVRFAVPNRGIVLRILNDSKDDDNPRLRAAANLLFPHISCLARLMSRHRIQLNEIDRNQLGVTLFLPPPPCPPPKSKLFSTFRRSELRKPRLQTIVEEDNEESKSNSTDAHEWIVLYEYLPAGMHQKGGAGARCLRLHA